MPTILPALATPQLQVQVQRMIQSDTRLSETPDKLALDMPITPDVSRARSIQPVSTLYPEGDPDPETQPERETATGRLTEEASQEPEGNAEDVLPTTQRFHDEDGSAAASGGGVQHSGEMDSQMDV